MNELIYVWIGWTIGEAIHVWLKPRYKRDWYDVIEACIESGILLAIAAYVLTH